MAKRALSTLKNYFKKYAYPTEQQFHDALDSFVHKDDKIGTDSLAQEVIDTFNNKAEVAALQAEVTARAQADDRLRDDLDETRGVYGTNFHGPVIRDKDDNEVFERTDNGMVQIDYPDGGRDQPAMQIDGNSIQLKLPGDYSRTVAKVEPEHVQLRAAADDDNDEYSEIELLRNGNTFLAAYIEQWGSKPHVGWVTTYGTAQGSGWKFRIDAPSGAAWLNYICERVASASKENNLSVKVPTYDDDAGYPSQQLLNANSRRLIVYHPNGEQLVYTNPDKVTKTGADDPNNPRMRMATPDGRLFVHVDAPKGNEKVMLDTDGIATRMNDMGTQSVSSDEEYTITFNDDGTLVAYTELDSSRAYCQFSVLDVPFNYMKDYLDSKVNGAGIVEGKLIVRNVSDIAINPRVNNYNDTLEPGETGVYDLMVVRKSNGNCHHLISKVRLYEDNNL